MAQPVKKDIFPAIFISAVVLSLIMLLYFIKVNFGLREDITQLDVINEAQIEKVAESERQRAQEEFQEKYSKEMQLYEKTYKELKTQKKLKKDLEAE